MNLFLRAARVQVQDVDISSLDVRFEVTRTLSSKPSTCSLVISNLAEPTRKRLEELDRVFVRLEAGYESGMSQLFYGGLKSVRSERDDVTILTKLEGVDGGRAHQTARVSRSFAPNTSAGAVLEHLAGSMGVQLGNAAQVFSERGLFGVQQLFSRGTVLSGSAAAEMDRVTASVGLEWSIQDERLQLLERGRALRGTALVLSQTTGLVGAPSYDPKKKLLQAQALIIPDLFPGRRIIVESEFTRGSYRVETCRFVGDTAGQDWYTHIEARPE